MPINELLRYIAKVKALYIRAYLMDRREEAHLLSQCLLWLRQSLEETLIREEEKAKNTDDLALMYANLCM